MTAIKAIPTVWRAKPSGLRAGAIFWAGTVWDVGFVLLERLRGWVMGGGEGWSLLLLVDVSCAS